MTINAKAKAMNCSFKTNAEGHDMTPRAETMTSDAAVKVNTQISRSKDKDNMTQIGVVLLVLVLRTACSGIIFLIALYSRFFFKLHIICLYTVSRNKLYP